MVQMETQAYSSVISFLLEPVIESGTFEYSKNIVQLEDEPSSKKLQNSLYTCMNIV